MSSEPTQAVVNPTESIVVRGARVHNLKNIDFEVPHNYPDGGHRCVGIGQIFAGL